MKILVTGGNGFLGSWCVVDLLGAGYDVRATVRSAAKGSQLRDAVLRTIGNGNHLEIMLADLEHDDGWDAAVSGCGAVLHVASPLPPGDPKDANTLVRPARDGTLRVLRACARSAVRRVVLTSSSSTTAYPMKPATAPITEECWSDLRNPKMNAYMRSKTIAESVAWNFVSSPDGGGVDLTVILPTTMLGPVLCEESFSVQAVSRLLNGRMPAVPRLGFSWVDVRDVAALHRHAIDAPHAGGQRFIASGTFLWMSDLGRMLRDRLGHEAHRVPTREAPDWFLRLLALFEPSLRLAVHRLSKREEYSSQKASATFGWYPRAIEETVIDCARSILARTTLPST
jgi:dihydroflavonol-4-reductase